MSLSHVSATSLRRSDHRVTLVYVNHKFSTHDFVLGFVFMIILT